MKDGYIQVYYGDSKCTAASIGQGIRAVNDDKKVIMIQFLSELDNLSGDSLKKLEPNFKVFNFAKKKSNDQNFCYVEELKTEITTAFNFAKKVLDTGECDILILDEILVAIEKNCLEEDTLCELLKRKPPNMVIILTGHNLSQKISDIADYIYYIKTEKE